MALGTPTATSPDEVSVQGRRSRAPQPTRNYDQEARDWIARHPAPAGVAPLDEYTVSRMLQQGTDPYRFYTAAGRAGQATQQQTRINTNNQYQNALNYFLAQSGIDPGTGLTAQTGDYIGRLFGQAQTGQANVNYLSDLLRQDFATNLARAGLGRQNLDIDRAAAQRQFGVIDALLRNTMGGFDVQDALSKLGFERGTRQETSEATAAGAVGSLGNRRDLGDLRKQFFLDIRESQLGRERAGITAEEDKAKTRDRIAAINLKAEEYGLDEKSFRTELERGLAKLNIDQYFNVNDILDRVNSASAQDRMIAEQVISNAMQYSSVFPNTAPGGARVPTSPRGRIPGTRIPVR